MQKKHLFTVLSCYVLWGVLPLFWHLLAGVDSALVLCGRLVFGAIFCVALMAAMKKLSGLRALLRDRAAMKYILMATPLICVNWGVYIWAVQVGRTVDASLGYYLNPLLVFVFSVVIFKEKCTRYEIAALAIAAAGVALSMLLFGSFPIVTLVLGFCFAAYGVCKKKAHADPIASITVETLLSAPFFLLYALLFQREGAAALTGWHIFLLVCGGALTVIPLMLYSSAVNHLPFITVGFVQYINPTLMLLCGLLLGEEIGVERSVPLIVILIALAVYSVGVVKGQRAQQEEAEPERLA